MTVRCSDDTNPKRERGSSLPLRVSVPRSRQPTELTFQQLRQQLLQMVPKSGSAHSRYTSGAPPIGSATSSLRGGQKPWRDAAHSVQHAQVAGSHGEEAVGLEQHFHVQRLAAMTAQVAPQLTSDRDGFRSRSPFPSSQQVRPIARKNPRLGSSTGEHLSLSAKQLLAQPFGQWDFGRYCRYKQIRFGKGPHPRFPPAAMAPSHSNCQFRPLHLYDHGVGLRRNGVRPFWIINATLFPNDSATCSDVMQDEGTATSGIPRRNAVIRAAA